MRKEIVAPLLACILLLPGCIASDDGVDLFGVEYREPPEAPDFTLFDQNGESFTLSEYEGKVVVVAFVYTSWDRTDIYPPRYIQIVECDSG